ncbi:MAG TPA: hypothetical protein VFK70_11165 [Vicinamibacteria bacterium]|nr:hypothetical protein [Vicinamibacteria bacterium]
MTREEAAALKTLAGCLTLGVVLLLAVHGAHEEGVREVIRWTARSSLVFLCAALVTEGRTGALRSWVRRPVLLRSLAVSHTIHALAIGTLAVQIDGRNLLERSSAVNVLGGAVAYAFIFWGALHPQSRLTSVGLVWIWGVFLFGYGVRALRMPMPYGFAVALLFVVIAIRLTAAVPAWRRAEAMIRE